VVNFMAIAVSVDWAANFALIEVSRPGSPVSGFGSIMFYFPAISVISIAFVYGFLPETKNRSVAEITELFERQAAGDRRASTMKGANATAA